MATLLEIKELAASYLEIDPADLTVNGRDLFLYAANQVRRTAELNHDFEFNRKLVTVTVNGTTGGNLELAVDGNSDLVDVKTVIEVGTLDDQGNLIPASWTTLAESIERQRVDTPGAFSDRLWRRDYEVRADGQSRYTFAGNEVRFWPIRDTNDTDNVDLKLEVYAFSDDWTTADLAEDGLTVVGVDAANPNPSGTYTLGGTDLQGVKIWNRLGTNFANIRYSLGDWFIRVTQSGGDDISWQLTGPDNDPTGVYSPVTGGGNATVTESAGTSDVWTRYGQQYLLWSTIVHLNKRFKFYVPRQEGNLPPPTDLADAGLQTLIDWDSNKFDQFRRHGR